MYRLFYIIRVCITAEAPPTNILLNQPVVAAAKIKGHVQEAVLFYRDTWVFHL